MYGMSAPEGPVHRDLDFPSDKLGSGHDQRAAR
jgi:hypothetical protein